MYQIVLMIHVLIALTLIALVLLQHGKGADMGASLGAGASSTVFGSRGTGGFLFKVTGSLALVFFVTSLSLSYMVSSQYQNMTQQQALPQPTHTQEPVIPLPVDSTKSGK